MTFTIIRPQVCNPAGQESSTKATCSRRNRATTLAAPSMDMKRGDYLFRPLPEKEKQEKYFAGDRLEAIKGDLDQRFLLVAPTPRMDSLGPHARTPPQGMLSSLPDIPRLSITSPHSTKLRPRLSRRGFFMNDTVYGGEPRRKAASSSAVHYVPEDKLHCTRRRSASKHVFSTPIISRQTFRRVSCTPKVTAAPLFGYNPKDKFETPPPRTYCDKKLKNDNYMVLREDTRVASFHTRRKPATTPYRRLDSPCSATTAKQEDSFPFVPPVVKQNCITAGTPPRLSLMPKHHTMKKTMKGKKGKGLYHCLHYDNGPTKISSSLPYFPEKW